MNCSGLTSVTFDTNAFFSSSFSSVFNNTPNIANITIGNNVSSIRADMFRNRTALTAVTIGSGVITIGSNAFSNTGLLSITVEAGNSVFRSESNCVIRISNNELVIGTNTSIIPHGVQSIGRDAFLGCTGLTNITIPNSVTSIGQSAFSGCTGLTSSIVIPNSVTHLGSQIFANCNLLKIFVEATSLPATWDWEWSLISTNPRASHTVYWGYTAENDVDGLYFNPISSHTAFEVLQSPTQNISEIIIPNSFNGLPVRGIGRFGFHRYTDLTSITIPSSVTWIGGAAFMSCTSLTSVTFELPSSLTSIGAAAFSGCTSLSGIFIPSSVTRIDDETFMNCTSLTSVTFELPSSVTSIGASAFSGCAGLLGIDIPHGVTSIGASAFSGCTGLLGIDIPHSVTSIGTGAFINCSNLPNIAIPISVTTIDAAAFQGCFRLTISVEAAARPAGWNTTWNGGRPVQWGQVIARPPQFLTAVPDDRQVTLTWQAPQPGGVEFAIYMVYRNGVRIANTVNLTHIDTANLINGVSYAYHVTAVYLRNSVSFESRQSNTVIVTPSLIGIPGQVTLISPIASQVNVSLRPTFEWERPTETVTGYRIYIGTSINPSNLFHTIHDENVLSWTPNTNLASNTTYHWQVIAFNDIGDGAPSVSRSFTTTTASFTGWQQGEHNGTPGLEFQQIGQSLNAQVRRGIADAEHTIIPETVLVNGVDYTVTIIHNQGFWGFTPMNSITIPSSVTEIGQESFQHCSGLTSVIFEYPSSVTIIGRQAFLDCIELTSITIPNSVTWIGERAFDQCINLTSVIFEYPSRVTEISTGAFSGCINLVSIVIPNGVATIGYGAFSGCISLISIVIPNGVTTIGDWAFFGCTNLTSIFIPNSVTTIGRYAFRGCTGLTSVTFESPSGLTEIGYGAFMFCAGLTSIVIPNSVTSIGEEAFNHCYALTSIVIPNSVLEIGRWAFMNIYNLTIYAEAESQPAGWHEDWNLLIWGTDERIPVVWGQVILPPGITLLLPENNAIDTPLRPAFAWERPTAAVTGYRIYLGTSANPALNADNFVHTIHDENVLSWTPDSNLYENMTDYKHLYRLARRRA
jgi:hypothetical protein